MVTTGVYCIINKRNGKRYVGSSATSLRSRLRYYQTSLQRGTNHNRHLQSAWNKYGAEAFICCILEKCPPEKCVDREQYWIDKLRTADDRFGYNICPNARSRLGVKATKDQLIQIRARAKEAMSRPEVRAKLSAAALRRDRNYSPEYRAKLSLSGRKRKGWKWEKTSNHWSKDPVRRAETAKKICEGRKASARTKRKNHSGDDS